ncbi:hypothetical protein ABB28_01490 [Stenotrophomonas chelatiphaga]|uniref:Uncharacterized protein n=1 Tax=Stenotrophomonas chelatiphaga TaxID=517011 RepID=A0A0R0D617_9GAMM|nr:hypothetical protein ABB28_01490 [Stenotrophomonas chelatiphaga]
MGTPDSLSSISIACWYQCSFFTVVQETACGLPRLWRMKPCASISNRQRPTRNDFQANSPRTKVLSIRFTKSRFHQRRSAGMAVE